MGAVSTSYLTDQPIKDLIDFSKAVNAHFLADNYYLSLRSNSFNRETGDLTDEKEIENHFKECS